MKKGEINDGKPQMFLQWKDFDCFAIAGVPVLCPFAYVYLIDLQGFSIFDELLKDASSWRSTVQSLSVKIFSLI
jgi:hypothetical protein